jgi:sec-independent protein translocase protein TatB
MFDLGFSEIAVVAVVALVVLGPERLPKVARTAGHMFGRLQRYVANVKADIAREVDASELSKIKQEVETAARSFESSVKEQAASFESEARAIEQEAQKTLNDAVAGSDNAGTSSTSAVSPDAAALTSPTATATALPPATASASASGATPTQAEILAAEDRAFDAMPTGQRAASRPSAQTSFDFGIEPSRRAANAKAATP